MGLAADLRAYIKQELLLTDDAITTTRPDESQIGDPQPTIYCLIPSGRLDLLDGDLRWNRISGLVVAQDYETARAGFDRLEAALARYQNWGYCLGAHDAELVLPGNVSRPAHEGEFYLRVPLGTAT